ncbi:GAF domain-containing protein [Methanobacterium congolense]|uniref:GAF domain protein n=1 Tax=Methanobacterium congolense TaxID=118062 RepID=A0A1D3L014_9EURY|nr:GAF domain-containing protein [Methanobacterium congolense]SCG84873.1 GAF domain protein [Methanobacterium congolense]
MEELSSTERLIVVYIKSHPPEDCMLDKITRGTSRSRATVLKYLEILNAKGILTYKFVGRSKLWSLTDETEIKVALTGESAEEQISGDVVNMATNASKLHRLMMEEKNLKTLIERPDTIVFTLNEHGAVITANKTFKTFFGNKNLHEIVTSDEGLALDESISKMGTDETINMELDLLEKPGIYKPYKLFIRPITNEKGEVIGTTFIGDEISQSKRSKRELETLLFIARAVNSASNEKQLLKEVMDAINTIIPFKHGEIFLKDGKNLRSLYNTKSVSESVKKFVKRSMENLETISAVEGDEFETMKSEFGDESLEMMISIPLIHEDTSLGAILLLTTSSSLSSVNLEDVEMAADELSSYLKMKALGLEKEEFVNTLVALNKVSGVVNSSDAEDKMLENAVTSTINSLGFDMGCIYLQDDKEELSLRVHRNLPEKMKNMCMAGMFKDLFSKTLEKQNLVYITTESEEYDSLEPSIRASGIKTLLILPIKTGDKIIGLLNMGSRKIKTYNKISLENLSSIGLQLGLALERSKLALKLKKG